MREIRNMAFIRVESVGIEARSSVIDLITDSEFRESGSGKRSRVLEDLDLLRVIIVISQLLILYLMVILLHQAQLSTILVLEVPFVVTY